MWVNREYVMNSVPIPSLIIIIRTWPILFCVLSLTHLLPPPRVILALAVYWMLCRGKVILGDSCVSASPLKTEDEVCHATPMNSIKKLQQLRCWIYDLSNRRSLNYRFTVGHTIAWHSSVNMSVVTRFRDIGESAGLWVSGTVLQEWAVSLYASPNKSKFVLYDGLCLS